MSSLNILYTVKYVSDHKYNLVNLEIFVANSKHINMPFTYSKGGKVTCKKLYMLYNYVSISFRGILDNKKHDSITIFSSDINYYSHIPFPSSFPQICYKY